MRKNHKQLAKSNNTENEHLDSKKDPLLNSSMKILYEIEIFNVFPGLVAVM